jgi:RNA polymerase sigma-70 factor (ECF subfamily)
VFGYILALVHNLTDADDLFQRTCLVMWRKFEDFDEGSNFVRWACAVARLEVLDFLRARRRKPLLLSEDLQHQLAMVQAEASAELVADRQAALAACLEKLSSVDRRMVEMCYGGNGTIEQAAANLGRSKHSIYNSLRRIRTALLECVRRTFAREGLL